jgi:uracil-DNA glycosylase family 4
VMVVSLCPDPADETAGLRAGSTLVHGLAEFMPALTSSADKVFVTTLMKCVPRTAGDARAPRAKEQDDCYPFLSRELTITTPHYVLPVGEETTRYLLGKLFKDLPYKKDDSLELRLFDNPAFKVVPVATPDELQQRDAKARKDYVERLRALAQVMGL